MNKKILSVLQSIDEVSKTQGGVYNISFQQGTFLAMLIKAIKAKNVLELGVSHGYSTIFLANALSETSGKVTAIEHSKEKVIIATKNLANAGLQDYVDIKHGSCLGIIPQLDQEFDLVFLDIHKDQYLDALHLFLPMVRKQGIIMADNILTHKDGTKLYVNYVRNNKDLQSLLVPIGNGFEMSLKI